MNRTLSIKMILNISLSLFVLGFWHACCCADDPPAVTCKTALYYGDHMVLQRAPYGAVLWGYADPGYAVNVTFHQVNYTSIAEPGAFGLNVGVWRVVLPPQPAGGPETINITCYNTSYKYGFIYSTIQLQDILFGDVWMCSGQSNMAFDVKQAFNGANEIAASTKFPNVRVLSVTQTESITPYYDVQSLYRPWSRPNPDVLGANAPEGFLYFSAVCWFYGRDLYTTYNVPIGLISSNWGGTPIQAWSAPNVIKTCANATKNNVHSNFSKTTKQNWMDGFGGPHADSVLWNAMIHPFLNMTIKGTIWYQGEYNTRAPAGYNCLFQNMISDWRYKWKLSSSGQTDRYFPFGFVQLCTSGTPLIGEVGPYPVIRWHQTDNMGYVPNSKLPNVFMAMALDLADLESPYGAIHPRYKQDVAARLVVAARVVAYQEKNLVYRGPFPTKFNVTDGEITVVYGSEGSGQIKLVGSVTDTFEVCCSNTIQCQDSDVWIGTTIRHVTEYSLIMSYNCLGDKPVALRYLWRDYACIYKHCTIYNADQILPAPPFMLPLI